MGDLFTVYRSSAGSGKTHTLVKEYIRLALSDPRNPARFAKILAITFTNKAAGEMKDRVMENLFTLQVPATHKAFKQAYLDEMSQFCQLEPQEIQLRAARVFKTMLHNYHLLKITTIDKFTVSLVYSFARDLDIDAEHEIVTDKNEVIEAGVLALIEQSGKDEELTSIFLNFLGQGIEEGDRFNIKKELRNFCSKVLDEKGYTALEVASEYSEQDFLRAHAVASEKIKAIEQKVKEHTQAIFQLLGQNGITAEDFHFKGIGNYSWIKKVDKEGFSEIQEAARVTDFLEGKRWQKNVSPAKKAAFEKVENEIVEHLEALLLLKKKERNSFLIHETVRNHTFSMALFKRLQQAIEQHKTSNSIILLSEFTKLVSDIVADEPAPFIYERLGERVKNIFVDEFQDTSSLQFGNLIPLMENSLATGDFVMLVGDAKQSIYRWRNGNVEQFIDLPKLPAQTTRKHPYRQKVFEGQVTEKSLPKNYRSMQNVVDFNNRFFESLLKTEIFAFPVIQSAYKDVKQESLDKKPGGYVDFRINFDKRKKNTEEDTPEAEKEITATVRWIKQAIDNGYGYGDIAILVRQHRDGEIIFNGLRQHGIPVVSNQAMSLAASDELKTINALFACLHETHSLTRIRQFAFLLAKTRNTVEQNERMIAQLYGKPGAVLLSDIFRHMDIRFSLEFFYSLNLYEQVYYIIHCLGFSQQNAFVSTYLELVFEFFRKQGTNAVKFIHWWENNAENLKLQTGSGISSVQIVTIHKSKGLQYPVVIVPFVNWTIRPSDRYFWLYEVPGYSISPLPVPLNKRLNDSDWKTENELESMRSAFDVLNILYVAFTRAEEQLFCYCDASSPNGLGKHLANVLNTLTENEDAESFVLGSPVVKGPKKPMQEPEPVATSMNQAGQKFLPWHNKLRVTAHFYQQQTDETPAQRRGILVHEIFAGLQSAEGIDAQMERYLVQGTLTKHEAREVKQDLQHLLGSPQFLELAQNALQLPEVEVFDGEKQVYRPDRLFLYPDGSLALLDLKTGDEEEHHLQQVSNYSHILQKSGYTQVQAWIYYVKTKKWIKHQANG